MEINWNQPRGRPMEEFDIEEIHPMECIFLAERLV